MKPNSWTTEPVVTGNTNRDGTGDKYPILEVTEDMCFVEYIKCLSLGTNVETEGVILQAVSEGTTSTREYSMLDTKRLPATTAGTASKPVLYVINQEFVKGTVLYALVHDDQSAGRQFRAKCRV